MFNTLEFAPDLLEDGRPLPIASMERALTDLRRVGRNTKLLLNDEIEAMRAEASRYEETTDAEFC